MTEKQIVKDLAKLIERIIIRESKKKADERLWDGLPKVLEVTQRILTDGSLKYDFRGAPECRTFVLNENDSQQNDLFGSANIEAWLHLQFSKKKLSQRLRDLYSNKTRLYSHYSKTSLSRNPELRQTFLFLIEALEELDIRKLQSLHLTAKKPTRPKSLKTKKSIKDVGTKHSKDLFSPKSRQLDFLETVITERKSLCRTSSLPNLSAGCTEEGSCVNRRRSVPDSRDFTSRDEGSPVQCEVVERSTKEERRFIKTHQRSRSDNTSTILYFQPVSKTCGDEDEADVGGGDSVTGSWSRIVPASTGWYPRPRANQSLVQFLAESGGEGSRRGGRAQLDRENAHFILSEAMISTFEQMNFERCLQKIEETKDDEESDDEIQELKKKLSRRRSELETARRSQQGLLSDGQTDDTTATTDQSASPGYSDCEGNETTDLLLDSSDEDFIQSELRSSDCSAESIALSLLSRVGHGRLPPADKLPWLVSRDMVDQDLIPLPSSLPVDPDTEVLCSPHSSLRGTLTWAPPRPQIVLTVQPRPGRRTLALSNQRWMCAGCGMKVEPRYSKSYRWCHYLGRFFCSGCHSNMSHVIPARIIHEWDFKKYPVSNFSQEILTSMTKEPVFNIHDLNPGLLRKVEKIKQVAGARSQLSKLARYVSNCRLAEELHCWVESCLVSDNQMFSIEDLCRTKAGKLVPLLRKVIREGLSHVSVCELCQARGHICQGCHAEDVLFPFKVGVVECPECYSCYHQHCFRPDTGCVRCNRRKLRLSASNLTPQN